MRGFSAGGVAALGYAVIGLVWTMLELTPQGLGFEDTDDPAVSLQYLRAHADVYAQAGLALFAMAIALTIILFATNDVLAGRVGSLALRVTTAGGLLAAACLFLFGVLRFSVHPLLYIDGLQRASGEAAYLVIQMVGIHGVGQAAIFLSSAWALGVAVLGVRAGVVPKWVAVLAILPGLRLVALVGPFVTLPDELWIAYMLAIPGTAIWFGLLGLTTLRRPSPPPLSA